MTLIRSEDSAFTLNERRWLAIFLGIVGLLTLLDVFEDWEEGASLAHILPEGVIVVMSVGSAVYLLQRMLDSRRGMIESTRAEIQKAREAAESWRQRAETLCSGITDAISGQFTEWGLSPAEQEVSFLLLKGLSIKEISEVRETTERTVRQQASEVYKKSGLSGRAQLSAFFLEDLFER